MSREALDAESSGYFLVRAGELPTGWRAVTSAEAAAVYGKGYTGSIDDKDTGDDDHKSGGSGGPCPGACCGGGPEGGGPLAMATYQFHTLAASLHIEDTPVGYSAAVGQDVRVRVAYNQREAGQPTTIEFTSFGPQFVSNWISYLIDNPNMPQANIVLRKRGGGSEIHSNYNAQSQSYGREVKTASVLYRLSGNAYKKVYPDGSEEFYEQYVGTTGSQRKVFLTRSIDPQGNEITIEYDSNYPTRIQQIVDASGLPTVFYYEYPAHPYLVTRIEDPYGREATFAYTAVAGDVRLQSIEDTQGIVSSFEYNPSGEIVSLTTPYGKTTFGLSPLFLVQRHNALVRYVEATDPLGQKERICLAVAERPPATG